MTATLHPLDDRPGLDVRRLGRLVVEAVARCLLTLDSSVVLTEAATGAYCVTPVIAAVAGADVIAVTRASQYGSVDEVMRQTYLLADYLGVANRIKVTEERTPEMFARADVITNSGHLRPIVGEYAAAIRSEAVLTLMIESWEIPARSLEVDLQTIRARGIQIAGTNERHPHVDVFSYLGPMAVAQLADAGVSAYGSTVAVLCDNPFEPYLRSGLEAAGAQVRIAPILNGVLDGPSPDALIIAIRPGGRPGLTADEVRTVADRWPGTVLAQYWGEIDREACAEVHLRCWPTRAPGTGHMGVLPSRVGPEPVVRLQTGGLKVAEVLRLPPRLRTANDLAYLDPL